MSDRDLASIAAQRPTTAEALENASTLGPITARRLAPELAAVIETAIEAGIETGIETAIDTAGSGRQNGQPASSTITGA